MPAREPSEIHRMIGAESYLPAGIDRSSLEAGNGSCTLHEMAPTVFRWRAVALTYFSPKQHPAGWSRQAIISAWKIKAADTRSQCARRRAHHRLGNAGF